MGFFDFLSNDKPAIANGANGPAGRYAGQTTQTPTGANYPASKSTTGPTLKGIVADSVLNKTGVGTDQGTVGGFLSAAAGFNPLGSFMNQSKYGMNDEAKGLYESLARNPKTAHMTQAELVNLARSPQMKNQLPHAMNPAQREAAGLAPMPTLTGATIPNGNADAGTFTPVTFRTGVDAQALEGTEGLSDLIGQGTGLFGQAGELAQQAPNEFNYNFNPEGRAQELFDQRSALLAPQFAQQRAMNNESMFGSGRLGLRLAGEGVGAGNGMVQPDAFGMNQAQAQALAQLSAQSTNDAFGQQMQQAGLDLSQFGTNQGLQQQQFGNLMGVGQGMLGAGMGNIGSQQQQQALDQGYSIDQERNDISRLTAEAQAERARYQPDPWLTGAVGLGSSFLGTDAGGSWLSKLFGGE